jgi:hypothetical protein
MTGAPNRNPAAATITNPHSSRVDAHDQSQRQRLFHCYSTPRSWSRNDDGGDVFAWDKPIWKGAGVVTPTGTDSGTGTTRNSFPARQAATRVLQKIMDLRRDPDD